MTRRIPHALQAVFVVVMMVLCVTVVTQLFRQERLQRAIDQADYDLGVFKARLHKQQLEYDEALSSLPVVQAELEKTLPLADAAYQQEQALRAQRKQLRADNAALKGEVEALTADLAHGSTDTNDDAIINQIQQALETLSTYPVN